MSLKFNKSQEQFVIYRQNGKCATDDCSPKNKDTV